MKKFVYLLLTTLFLHQGTAFGQTTISGTVTDASSYEPLAGATVKSDVDSVVANSEGQFSIKVGSIPTQLQIRFIGYTTSYSTIDNTNEVLRVALTPSTLALNEVFITSGIQEDKIRNITNNVDLISKSMLERDNPFSITSSLNRIPGLYMHSGTYNTNRITIRGIGSRDLYGTSKIKAYYDQIPLTDGSGNSTIEDIDQAMIERIEVVKGPNSNLYGAGLAGVIRLNSYKPTTNETSLESQLTLGSYATRRWMNRFSHDDTQKSIGLVYSKMTSDGYRENSEYDREQIGITSRFYLDDDSYVSLLGVYTDLKAYIPSSINADAFRETPRAAAGNWAAAKGYEQYNKGILGISYHTSLSENVKLSSSIFTKYRDAQEATPIEGQGILEENTTSIGTRNILTYETEQFTVSAGAELFFDTYKWNLFENLYADSTNGSVRGPVFSINEEKRDYSNLFAEAIFRPVPELNVVVGINLNHTNYTLNDKYTDDDLDQSGDYSFGQVWSPRVSASYKLNSATSIYANVSHGFSPPTLTETLAPDGLINTEIKPESGWNYEIGLRGNKGYFNYDLTGYYMHIENLLVAQRVGENQYIGVNAGTNKHIGVDLYTNYYLPLNKNYTLNAFNSLSWMHYRFTDFENEGTDHSGNQLTGVPQLILNPGLELISEAGFYGNINGQYVGAIPIDDANSLYSDPYFILNTKVGYRVQTKHLQVDLSVGANNLSDERYASMLLINGYQARYYYPGLPVNYFGGLTVKYIF